ncbi:hypothetical protein PRIC1_013720 [Phytophthora ramorum]
MARVQAMAAVALLASAAHAACDPSKWTPPSDGVYNTSSQIDPNKLNVHLIAHSHDDPGWLMGVDQYYMEKVQYILDTAVEELVRNPDRQFMFVEQSFFQRWWHEQGSEVQGVVKQLVKEGRLDLTVNGGWCMHDEATPHYIAMVDQTAYGHQLLMDEFGISPRIGWQIDPFGHSATQGSLLSQGVGFDALYFARMDYQDYGLRKKNKDLEFIWRPSKSRGKESQVFTDDADLHDYDVCDEVEQFVNNAKMRGGASKGNHVFIPMGCDFQYDNSRHWFKNMDKLIHYVNQDARVNVLYSNLSYYTDVKHAEGLTWSVKTDDFMPYASDQDDYWSGFFTSRPTLKRFARVANTLLQQAEKELNEVLFVIGEKEPYHFCLLANTSVCDVSTQNTDFEVLMHNALARTSVQTLSVPITHRSAEAQLLSGDARLREQNVYVAVPVHPETSVAPNSFVFSVELKPLSTARFLVKQKDASDDSNVRGGVEYERGNEGAGSLDDDKYSDDEDVVVLENHLLRAEVSKKTGSITKLANKKKNIQIPLSLDVAYYQAFQGDGHKSGAYVFRPDSNQTYPVTGGSGTAAVPRVAFKIGKWVTLEYRVNDDDEFLEIEWTVGPVPIDDKKGKEVIVRFDAGNSIASDSTLYTDSNGTVAANYFPITTGAYIKDAKRQLNVVTDRAQGAASLVDGQVEVMVHRRLLADDDKGVGEHLNETEAVYDSANKKLVTKGLAVRGNFFVNVDSAEDGMRSLRSKMESQFFRPLAVFRKPVASGVEAKVPWLAVGEFPPNVGLTTLQELSKQCLLVRLSHLYAVEEHSTLSQPATVDFSSLFSVKNSVVSEVTELTLTGTKELSVEGEEIGGLEWKTTDEAYGWSPRSLPVKGTSVTLQAIEVRAFRVCFGKGEEEEVGATVVEDDSDLVETDGTDVDSWDEEGDSFGYALQDLAEMIAMG